MLKIKECEFYLTSISFIEIIAQIVQIDHTLSYYFHKKI